MKEKEEKTWDTAAEIRAEQKEALKNMSFKQKAAYFWEYYRLHVFIAIAVVAVVVSIVGPIINRKPYSFYAIMLNSYELDGNQMAADFAAFADLDTENFTCFIDTTSLVDINITSENDIAAIQRVLALAMAGDLDVIVTDGPTFLYYGYGLLFGDLRLILTAEELEGYEGRLFYIDQAEIDRRDAEGPDLSEEYTTELDVEEGIAETERHRDPSEMGDPVPIGVFMGANESYAPYEPIFGFVVSSSRMETAQLYLDFLKE
ncbi:MAG: hypothetical protein LBI54_02405 [Lachnospiraceae bacterium]|jgi:hypothetical protein|nr:hypothetical protein [Lachnospiraceae bacterium]